MPAYYTEFYRAYFFYVFFYTAYISKTEVVETYSLKFKNEAHNEK